MIPPDFTLSYGFAFGLVFAAWFGYRPFLALFGKGTLNEQLTSVRSRWMSITATRENRTFDGLLFGQIVNSLAFFGSATLLLLAGLLSTLANLNAVHRIITGLPFIEETSLALFASKLGLLILLLTASFFSFAYALTKMIYTVALIGSLPEDEDDVDIQSLSDAAATVLSDAVQSFNAGIRGYYFAVGALVLFIGPVSSLVVTTFMFGLLIYRQTVTSSARAISRYADVINAKKKRGE